MSEKKTIKINPELFKVSDKNTSRKKREKSEVKIKVKSEKPVRNKSLRRSVLKMIREKQQEEYKKLFSNHSLEKEKDNPIKNESQHFNKDFEDSLQYFNSLVEKEREKENLKNHTLRKYPEINPSVVPISLNNQNEFPNMIDSVVANDYTPSIQIHQPQFLKISSIPPPKYGCLKNGSLPTYRNFHNITRRVNPVLNPSNNSSSPMIVSEDQNRISNTMQPVIQSHVIQTPIQQSHLQPIIQQQQLNSSQRSNEIQIKNDLSEKRQKFQKGQESQHGNKKYLKYLKRRKIYKRTYKIGRSTTKPQISVLVSNKTIRNRITTEAQRLKQTPIQDVRQFLVKKGFIKVGSVTPNDVLRKMYESVSLICGEVQNHNPENLLYNFMNDNKS